jgi:hypothetical protein
MRKKAQLRWVQHVNEKCLTNTGQGCKRITCPDKVLNSFAIQKKQVILPATSGTPIWYKCPYTCILFKGALLIPNRGYECGLKEDRTCAVKGTCGVQNPPESLGEKQCRVLPSVSHSLPMSSHFHGKWMQMVSYRSYTWHSLAIFAYLSGQCISQTFTDSDGLGFDLELLLCLLRHVGKCFSQRNLGIPK